MAQAAHSWERLTSRLWGTGAKGLPEKEAMQDAAALATAWKHPSVRGRRMNARRRHGPHHVSNPQKAY